MTTQTATKPKTIKAIKDAEREEAKATLREILKPGQTVYCILRHRSASGMMRVIDLCIAETEYRDEYPLMPVENSEYLGQRDYSAKPKKLKVGPAIRHIGFLAARALGDNWDRDKEGIRAGGCGMDMGFNLVYNLGRVLFPEGFAYSEKGIRPLDGKLVNINAGRGFGAGPLTQIEMEALRAKDWKFPGGRNGDASGWDSDGGYALKSTWL